MSSSNIIEIFEKSRKIIDEVKQIQKTLYQLCFIVLSENPKKNEAEQIINEMIKLGLVSEDEVRKAFNDVLRWRRRILDKDYL